MAQRVRSTEAVVTLLPTPKVPAQQHSRQTTLGPPKTPSQRILNLQRAIGNRAVQGIILSRGPAAGPVSTSPPPVTDDKTAVSSEDRGAQAPAETAPTDWYLDSWGVAADKGTRGGRRDSKPDDVLMLEGLKIGSGQNSKSFDQSGNALRSGRSSLGPFNHSKGPGHVSGVVKYASQREIVIDFKPNTPPESGRLDRAAKAAKEANEKATKASAEKMVLAQIRDQDNELSGNWDEIEKKAAATAAAQLPEGSKPEVKIDTKVKHAGHRLETTSYRIDKPSACTIKINVPTTTTTYQVRGGESTTTTDSAGVAGSTSESQKIDVGSEVKTFAESTRSSFIETVNSVHNQITKEPGEIESDKGSDPSLTERAKKWLKDKASGLWDKARDTIIGKAKSFLKSRLTNWIIKGLRLESYIEIKLTEWLVDWLGDKAWDKIKGWFVKARRTPGPETPCGPGSITPGPSTGPTLPDPRFGKPCPTCHDRHPGPNPPSTPQRPTPDPTPPKPAPLPCPPESKPPLIQSDDHEIHTIFSESTKEIVSTAQHANLEVTKEESESGFAEAKTVHHTEHYYSGPVTKETIGHPTIEVIVEERT